MGWAFSRNRDWGSVYERTTGGPRPPVYTTPTLSRSTSWQSAHPPLQTLTTQSEFYVPADAISPIAHPLAQRKLQKKLFRTTKKASKARQLKRGVKEVVKALRKGEKGLLLLASNITPMDVISHLPLMAEEASGVEYCWVLSKCVSRLLPIRRAKRDLKGKPAGDSVGR